MSTLSVGAAIFDDQERLLLIRREDLKAWALPGGRVEDGESVAQAAIREAYEETGLQVELTRMVGIYSIPLWQTEASGEAGHKVLFAARPTGGELRLCPVEVQELGFYTLEALPEPLIWWHRQMIEDSARGIGGSVAWMQRVQWPFPGKTRQELYAMLARGELSLEQIYEYWCRVPGPEDQQLEVGEI